MTRPAPEQLVRERRRALGLSQAAAAEQAGISRNEWNQMENSKRGIGPTNAARMVQVLGGEESEYVTQPVREDIEELRRRVDALERQYRDLLAELERLHR